MRERKIEIKYEAIGQLKVSAHAVRVHPKGQITKLKKSIEQVGFINPVVVDSAGQLIAGHARLLAAKALGYQHIPTIPISDLSEPEVRAYALADNKLCEIGGWDIGLLKVELEYLTRIDLEVDLDIDMTGFAMAEIDLLLADHEGAEEIPVPDLPVDDYVISRPGDLWQLGTHRIVCGDTRDPAVINRLMGGKVAQMQISDPPYNVPTAGHISTSDKAGHGDFEMACGEMSREVFVTFLVDGQSAIAEVCAPGSLHYLFIDWRHMEEMLAAIRSVYSELINLCVWTKTNGGMGSFYRSQHELVFIAKKGKEPHINNIQLGAYGRYRTNVWQYAGMNAFSAERDDNLKAHPTVKPMQMIADAIMDASNRGDIVLDGFLGSGTTLLAAEKTGRVGYGVELDPRYVDVAIQRWQALTGQQAVHAVSGSTFDELSADTEEVHGAVEATA